MSGDIGWEGISAHLGNFIVQQIKELKCVHFWTAQKSRV